MSIAKSDFHAALDRLERVAKGGATQLYHTSSDSVPGQHAGTGTSDTQDEFTDGIDDNGTDYNGVKAALATKVEKSQALTPAEVALVKGQDPRPLIAEKVAKGEKLTAAESWVVKGGLEKANAKPSAAGTPGEQDDANSAPDTNAGANTDEEIEPDAKKSLDKAIAGTQNLRKGLEMSPILVEFAQAMGLALRDTQVNVQKSVLSALQPVVDRLNKLENHLAKSVNEQGEFNKGFAETLIGIGQHVAGSAEAAQAQASLPAAAPKSHLRALQGGQNVQVVQKSFGPGGLNTGSEAFAKSQIVDALADLVKGGKLSALEVVKYESTGEINPNVFQMAMNHLQGR